MSTLYTAKVKAHGGREGKVETKDGKFSFDLAKPGSSKENTTNPEQLFACGYASCFSGAVDHIAKEHGIDSPKCIVEADAHLNQVDDGFAISVDINVTVPDVSEDVAQKIVREAHAFCPYSRAVKGNIDVNVSANGAAI